MVSQEMSGKACAGAFALLGVGVCVLCAVEGSEHALSAPDGAGRPPEPSRLAAALMGLPDMVRYFLPRKPTMFNRHQAGA